MQIRKKRRIVIASLLKPVDDTRMFEKMGVSLSKLKNAEVHIIGRHADAVNVAENVTLHGLKPFDRLSARRVLAPAKVAQLILKLKPEILVVNTSELLIVAILFRILFGTKIIYDIRENYALNVVHSGGFSPFTGKILSVLLMVKQTLCAPFFNHFFLAEKCYLNELAFVPAHKTTVLENKTVRPGLLSRNPSAENLTLIFTGTLSTTTGVFRAIELVKKLHSTDPKIRLHITGYCALTEERKMIFQEAEKHAFIHLTGIDYLINHQKIVEAISMAHAGIIAYEVNPATENKIPTKLYEYLGYQLPILLTDHAPWLSLCPPGTALNFERSATEQILTFIQQSIPAPPPEGVFWDTEEYRLIEIINKISSN
jgi:glycosyltransferase involved in cell wall biosynthesis